MQVRRHGKTGPEPTGPEMVLGRCLVEGDLEATSRARRTRRKTFGVSLAIEILLLGLLVAAPLLTSVAQPGYFKAHICSLCHRRNAPEAWSFAPGETCSPTAELS